MDDYTVVKHAETYKGLDYEYDNGHFAVYCGSMEDATLVAYYGGDDYRVIRHFTGETAIDDAIRACDDEFWAEYS